MSQNRIIACLLVPSLYVPFELARLNLAYRSYYKTLTLAFNIEIGVIAVSAIATIWAVVRLLTK